jgi:MFS transporter, PAT family, beta-lactamase induction signal transducer AmpG
MVGIFLLALSTGIPVSLGVDTFKVWMLEDGYSLEWITLINLVSLPYIAKMFLGPVVDQIEIPVLNRILGRRRAWSIVAQLFMLFGFIALGFAVQYEALVTAITTLCLISVASALNHTALNAYRIEAISVELTGVGAVMSGLGYRIGKLIAGAGALLIAAYLGWNLTYIILPSLFIMTILTTLLSKEPPLRAEKELQKRNLFPWSMLHAIRQFLKTYPYNWKGISLFIIAFGIGDFLVEDILTLFYLDIGFNKIEIANIAKAFGLICTIIGGIVGGQLIVSYGIRKVMIGVSLAHCLSYLSLVMLSHVGYDIVWLYISVVSEFITAGMKTSVLVSFISLLCGKTYYTASQYALFSTLKIGLRPIIGSVSGVIALHLGWSSFFILSIVLCLLPLCMYAALKKSWEKNAVPL